MAILTDREYGKLRRLLYRGVGKAELKNLPNLPTKAELRAAFQAVEDDLQGIKPTVKANIDAALGITTTARLATEIVRAWFLVEFDRGA